MEMEISERLLAEFAGIEPIFSQGLLRVFNIGSDVAMYYWKWGASPETGQICPVPAAIVIRPRATVWKADQLIAGAKAQMLAMAH